MWQRVLFYKLEICHLDSRWTLSNCAPNAKDLLRLATPPSWRAPPARTSHTSVVPNAWQHLEVRQKNPGAAKIAGEFWSVSNNGVIHIPKLLTSPSSSCFQVTLKFDHNLIKKFCLGHRRHICQRLGKLRWRFSRKKVRQRFRVRTRSTSPKALPFTRAASSIIIRHSGRRTRISFNDPPWSQEASAIRRPRKPETTF